MIDALLAIWELEYERAGDDLADAYCEAHHENFGLDWDFTPEEWCPELHDRFTFAETTYQTLRKLRGLPKHECFWF